MTNLICVYIRSKTQILQSNDASMNKFFSKSGIWMLLILILGFFILSPILRPGFIVTDDGNWMVIRLSAFYQSLRDGQFPVRFLGRLNYSYGYPVANFLYPGFMYFGSVMHALGLSFQQSVEAILILSVIGGTIGAFFWLRIYFDTLSSMLGSLAVLMNPYFLYDVYTRGSVGEAFAIGISFWVLYSLESSNYVLYIPLLSLLLISHNTAALFCMLVITLLIATKNLSSAVRPTLIACGISSFFWIPAIIERRFVLFDSVSVSNPFHYFPASMDLLYKSAPLGLLCLGILFLQSKLYEKERSLFSWLLIVAAFFISQLSGIFWGSKILQLFVQFPYRLFIFWIISGAWIIAYISESWKKIGIGVAFCSILWMGYSSISYFNTQNVIREDGYYSTNEGTTTVANEYMPRWVSVLPSRRADERIEVLSGNATITPIEINTNRIHVQVHAKEDSELQINTLFYPGWGAMIDDMPVNIAYNNDQGLMRMPILAGEHSLFMEFRETKSRFAADMITLLCGLLYVGMYLVPSISRRRLVQ